MGRCLCGGLQILILIAAGLQIQQNEANPAEQGSKAKTLPPPKRRKRSK